MRRHRLVTQATIAFAIAVLILATFALARRAPGA
jgi:hypothetical protein